MAIQKKAFKDSLQSKNLNYCNTFFELKNTPNVFTDSFPYKKYEALSNLNDVKTNNFSNLFLPKRQLTEDWLDVKGKPKTDLNIVSTLSFEAGDTTDPTNPGVWLFFNKTYTFWDTNLKEAPYYMTYGRPDEFLYNYFFYIEYISDTQCRISHNFGDLRFYLTITNDLKIYFSAEYSEENCLFNYNLQGNQFQLYKTIISPEDNSATIYTLSYQKTEDEYSLTLSSELTPSNSNIIYLNQIENGLELYINNSYVAYDQSKYITAIDNARSAFFVQGQALFHHQYNKDSEINFVPLKNNLTYQGQYTRGDNLTFSYDEYPDVNYRNYVSIQSGLNQEHGNDSIILNY